MLFLFDPLDEFVLDHLHEYDKKPFKMAESADIPLEEKAEAADEAIARDAGNLITYLKTIYGEQIQDVKISRRLIDSPCLLLNPADGPSVQMEKIMRMVNKDYPLAKRVFEINPGHPLIRKMVALHQADPAGAAAQGPGPAAAGQHEAARGDRERHRGHHRPHPADHARRRTASRRRPGLIKNRSGAD